jgi:hypothetical protein
MEMFPSGFRPYSGPDDSDNVSLPDSERQRLYQESQGTWRDYAANPLSFGATPLTGNIPTFQQWAAGNPEIIGDNSPEYQYLQQFYQLPNKSDIWETVLPMAGMAAMGAAAGGAFGNLSTYGSAGGTFGAGAGAAGSSAVGSSVAPGAASGAAAGGSGGISAAEAAALAETGGLGAGGGLSAGELATIESLAGGAGTGGLLGSQQAIDGSMQSIYGDLAQAGIEGYDLGNVPIFDNPGNGLWGQIKGFLPAASTVANALTQPTGNTTFGIPNNILAGGLQGLLGYLGAGQQADAYQDVYNQQSAIGAPYRDRLNASYQPGFDLMSQPGYGDAFNRMAEISTNSWSPRGNPANNPGIQAGVLNDVWSQNYLPALSNYRGQLGQFGGMGLNTAGQSSLMGAQTAGSGLNALGFGLNTMFQQPSAIDDYYRQAAERLRQQNQQPVFAGGVKYGG